MNILYLGDPSPQSHDSSWMKFFLNTYNRIFLICRKKHFKKEGYPYLEENGIQLIGYVDDFSLIRPAKIIKSLIFLKSVIRKYDIEVFHILYAEPNALWALGKDIYKCKTGLTTRGTDILVSISQHGLHRKPQDYYVYPLYQKAFKKIDFVTCTSNSQKEQIEGLTNSYISPHIIRTGIDLEFITRHKIRKDLAKPKKKYILFPRSMKPLYNHEFAVKSLQNLCAAVKSEYTVVFLDKDSNDSDYVKSIQSLLDQLADINYLFLKRLDRQSLFHLYDQTALMVITTRSDGTPVSALEAMALEIPLILPPIKYDEDLFGDWIYKLGSWSEIELGRLISDVLLKDHHPQLAKAREIVYLKANYETEMLKLQRLYEV